MRSALRALRALGEEGAVADEAERERNEVLAEARRAADLQQRRLGEEQARLLGVRSEQVAFRAELEAARATNKEQIDEGRELVQRVSRIAGAQFARW